MTGPCLYTTAHEMAVIRQRLAEHDWYARCFANLRAPVDELLRRGIRIPHEKGFVFYETCPVDNTRLRHDPFDPGDRSCPTCGVNYTEEPYYRAWVTFYQSYLSQRAVDMGIVYQVTGDDAYAEAIRHILTEYALRYVHYPLVDCVLGPTRLFESTYIESLWLASLAAAADLVRDAIPPEEWRLLRDELFLPSARVILDYDEGNNNRQAMNNTALGLAGILCDESSLVDYALSGPHGWLHHLEHSVLEDGLWYEGDNYHFATLPAMANLAEALARNGTDLYTVNAGGRQFKMMFDGPLLDLYPDLTFPARKDSRFASPIGQRWYVGLYELAYRRYGDPAYAGLLRTLYAHPPTAASCLANAAGLIDVLPGHPASREWLDWRGFLNAVPELDTEAQTPEALTRSVNMTGAGLGILRQDRGRTYAAIDYGPYGGGHGHPDRLQLNFYARGKRWLTDWGTGNYFLDHLHWYRSAIAHNTVTVDGKPHQPVGGACRRFATSPSTQLVSTEVDEVYPGVHFQRTAILLSPDLLLDLFTVDADREHHLDWAVHPYGALELEGADTYPHPASIYGDQYDWLQHVQCAPASEAWTACFRHDGDALALHMLGAPGTVVYTALAYGPPPDIPNLFPVLIARRTATQTTFAALFEHRAGERAVVDAFSTHDGDYEIGLRDGNRWVCRYDASTVAASVTRFGADGHLIERSDFNEPVAARAASVSPIKLDVPSAIAFLGRDYELMVADQIRRSERHWRGPDDLSARFRLDRDGDLLTLSISVTDDVVTCSGPVEKPYDYDSVQVYFDPRPGNERTNTYLDGIYGLILIPASADGKPARIVPITDGPSLDGVTLNSSLRPDGYDLALRLPLARLGRIPRPGDKLGFDLIVNDNDGTYRRSLQMIWTGADGSRTWLRQDYHAPQRYGTLVFQGETP